MDNEEANKILDYIPYTAKTQEEIDYFDFLWKSFCSNYDGENYQFAFLSYHMLFMCAVYTLLAKMRLFDKNSFVKGMILCNDEDKKKIIESESIFIFSLLNERQTFQLFSLIGCSPEEIREYKKLIDDRNDIAHANGNIFFNSKEAISEKINELTSCLEKLTICLEPLVLVKIKEFLISSIDPETREFEEDNEQFEQILVKANYLSRRDIYGGVAKLDISSLNASPKFGEVKGLFDKLKERYSED